jgi:tetratricopeptide (TPR) repeat protein
MSQEPRETKKNLKSGKQNTEQVAKKLRHSSSRAEELKQIRRKVRTSFNTEIGMDIKAHFEDMIENSSFDALNNEFIDFKRQLEIDRKTRRNSNHVFQCGDAIVKVSKDLLSAKLKHEKVENKLDVFKAENADAEQSPQVQIDLRNLILHSRRNKQQFDLLTKQILSLFHSYTQLRNKEIAEEKSLKESTAYYLQYVDASQRAQLEVLIDRKLKDMPYEMRIQSIKSFIDNLVKSSASVKQAELERLLGFAEHLLEHNDPRNAIAELETAKKYNPDDKRIFSMLGQCYEQLNDTPQRVANLSQVIRLDNRDLDAHIQLANIHEESGAAASAIQHYQIAYTLNPHSFKLLTHFAYFAYIQKEWKLAIPLLAKILEQKPKSIKTKRRLGAALVYDHQFDRGYLILKNLLRSHPDDAQAYVYLGQAFRLQQLYKDAQEQFKHAFELDPKNEDALYYYALIHFDRGDYEEAEALCKEALHSIQHRKIDVLVLYASSLVQQKRSDEAVALLAPLVKNKIKNKDILYTYAQAALDSGQAEEAYKITKPLLEQHPQVEEYRLLMGNICLQSARFKEAGQYFG